MKHIVFWDSRMNIVNECSTLFFNLKARFEKLDLSVPMPQWIPSQATQWSKLGPSHFMVKIHLRACNGHLSFWGSAYRNPNKAEQILLAVAQKIA